jgi:hypothetical protein
MADDDRSALGWFAAPTPSLGAADGRSDHGGRDRSSRAFEQLSLVWHIETAYNQHFYLQRHEER